MIHQAPSGQRGCHKTAKSAILSEAESSADRMPQRSRRTSTLPRNVPEHPQSAQAQPVW